MCGRFVQFSSIRTLEKRFPIQEILVAPEPNYNAAPTQSIAVILKKDRYCLDALHWGLVPFWAKDTSGASRMINARSETVATKPSFRDPFKRRRCLIPANGFYEWTGEKGRKQPWFLHLHGKQPFAFAGLYESWSDKQATAAGPDYRSVTILTTAASPSVRKIHHRMPVILTSDAYKRWLDPSLQELDRINRMLSENCIADLEAYPVSKIVNQVKNNSPECINPLD